MSRRIAGDILHGSLPSAILAVLLAACPGAYVPFEGGDAGLAPECGDSIVDPWEECDDGNPADDDACTRFCRVPVCGDGLLRPGEECDDGNTLDGDACTSVCKTPRCGDGLVSAGEACDDGNSLDGDACTSECKTPRCGDGLVSAGEMCDDGNLVDTDTCPTTCQAAVCGDGFVQDGIEACDDGNEVETDACLSTCVPAACGDGFIHEGVERCDGAAIVDGLPVDCRDDCTYCGDGVADAGEQCDEPGWYGCGAECRLLRRVFVTDGRFTGAFGGLAGADQICQGAAQGAGLPGWDTYKAWISVGSNEARDRLDDTYAGLYVLCDPQQTIVADGWADLVDGQLDVPIGVNENGVAEGVPYDVWTSTFPSGGLWSTSNCLGFTSSSDAVSGAVGRLNYGNTWWSAYTSSFTCNSSAALYCFEDQ